jgi:serine/threonine protein kinase
VEPPKNMPETAPTERPPEPVPADSAVVGVSVGAATELQSSEPPKAVDPWLGRELDGRYRITERLGEGGMGAVFVAEHLKLHKQVALKVIRAELAGNGEVAARFAREAMATAQFEHPHVASAIDYGTLEEGGAFLVMQLVRGKSLRDVLDKHGKLAWPLACELLAQVADALSAARGAGIVHRDLKPENILVETREDGSRLAKILDFGIAHVAPHKGVGEGTGRELTRVGTVMGTPGYMAPEQAVGDRVDHRTDLYALGVVLWECIAGRLLWDGPDITSIIARQMRDEVPRLRQLPQLHVPRALDDLIQRLCARAADDRPDHAGAVRDELRALAHAPRLPERPFTLAREASLHVRRYALGLSPQRRALLGLGVTAALLGFMALVSGKPQPPAADHQVVPAPELGKEAASPTLVQRAVDAARKAIGDKPGASGTSVPAELEADVKTMQESSRSSDRRKSALRVLGYKGPARLPPHLRAIAKLEEARSCRDRKQAIAAMTALKDTRCLDSLRRYADSGRSGCGFLSLEDCYGCIRGDLRKAIATLEGHPEAAE